MIDITNSFFVCGGALVTWLSVGRLLVDKDFKGISLVAQYFFAIWSVWNLVYFGSNGHWWSFTAAFVHATGNVVWLGLFLKLKKIL